MPRYYTYREINALNDQASARLYRHWRPEHPRSWLVSRVRGHLRGETVAPGGPHDLLWLCVEWNEGGRLVRRVWLLYDGIRGLWSFVSVRQLLLMDAF